MKTSSSQFELMVGFMEKHGDLSKPSSNAKGKISTIKLWEKLTSLLNSDATGDTKTTEKWKKVWSDYKNNTKKKAARLYKATRDTGGGPAIFLKFTNSERRVLNLTGVQVATGFAAEEARFLQDIPIQPLNIEETQQPLQLMNDSHLRTTSAGALSPTHSSEVLIRPELVLSGRTTPRHVRQSRIRRIPRRRTGAPLYTNQAAENVLRAEQFWRKFKIKQHRDYMEMRREQNRIRELEVQAQHAWQAIGLNIVNMISKIVDRICKD